MEKLVPFGDVAVGSEFGYKEGDGGFETFVKISSRRGRHVPEGGTFNFAPRTAFVMIEVPDPPKPVPPTSDEIAASRRIRFERRLDEKLASAKSHASLDRFAQSFAANPFYAFENCDRAFTIAAQLAAFGSVRAMLDGGNAETTDDRKAHVDSVIDEVLSQVVYRASYPSQSTSAMTNYAHAAYTAALAELVDPSSLR